MTKIEAIKVYLWGKYVGAIALEPTLGYYAFEYDKKFILSGIEIDPLNMPLSRAREPYVFPGLPVETYKRLPSLLSDALPDDFGNSLIDAWMAEKGISRTSITPLDRLAYMGRRGMGALEFKPAQGSRLDGATAIQLSRLVESARMAISGGLETDRVAKSALTQLIQVGTSAGGARAKAVIAWDKNRQQIRAGQFDVEPGFEHWMLKLDVGNDAELGASQNFGRIEYAYSLMAKAAGIDMSECELLEEGGRAHFLTKRFDRDGNIKHHMMSLCAMAHIDYKMIGTHDYSQLFMTVTRLGIGAAALEEAFRRMVFNVLAVNCDDHSKNFSFLLKEGAKWELAPAYDITHSFNPNSHWVSQHLMSVNGKFAGAGREDFLKVADRFAIGRAQKIIRQVEEAISAWPDFAAQAGVNEQAIKTISAHIKIRPV